MNIKKLITLLAAFGIATSVAACNHGGHGMNPEAHMQKMVEKLSSKLDLNESQQGILKKLTTQMHQAHSDKNNADATKAELKSMILSQDLSPEQILQHMKQKKAKMEAKMDSIAPQLAQTMAEFHKSLNTTQKEKLVELMDKMPMMMMGH